MRVTRFILIAAIIVALLAAIAWFLRDNLIQRVSNPLLQKYGIVVTDVSLDALARENASIGFLELVHDKGTTIIIEDLRLPLGTKKGPKTYQAKRISVLTATRSDGELLELAELISQFLSLPENLKDSVLLVEEFSLPPYPPVQDVRWEFRTDAQQLRGTVESVAMSATIARKEPGKHTIVFSVLPDSAPVPGQFITADMQHDGRGFLLNGTSPIDLPFWESLAKLSGMVPQAVDLVSGTARLQINVDIPSDATQTPTLQASLAPDSALQINYSVSSGDVAGILVESASDTAIAATFPDVDWSLQLPEATLSVTYGNWQEIPVLLSNVACNSGPVCAMATRVSVGSASLPVGNVKQMEFASTETVEFPEAGIRIAVQPGATLSINRLRMPQTSVGRFQAQVVSSATLEIMESGWRLGADSLDASVETISASDDLSVSMPLFVENIRAADLDGEITATAGIFAPSSQATFGEQRIATPGLKGDISLSQGTVSADLATVGLQQDGEIKAQHSFAKRAGRLKIAKSTVSFGERKLSGRIAPRPSDKDLVSGTVSVELDARWTPKNSGLKYEGRGSTVVADLAGYYGETAFTGLSTQLSGSYRDGIGFAAEESTIAVALIDAGVPVQNLSADYWLDLSAASLDVTGLRMSALGGSITADPFSFRTDRAVNTLVLRAASIDLAKLLSLEAFEAIEVSGRIAAMLPVTIEKDTVSIAGGNLTGLPPGGVIRYTPGKPPDDTDTSGLGFATRVLGNFEYKTLTSDVNLTRNGDLKMKLQLTGRNPDLDEKRPVVLNLGVENNIPQMLKSLQAARAVEEILEERLAR